MLHHPVGAAKNGSLDHDEVGYQLARGPAAAFRARLPLVRADGIGGAEEAALSVSQFLQDGIEPAHEMWRRSFPSTGALQFRSVDVKTERRLHTVAPPACSNACANCRTRASPKAGPKICRPTGNLPQTFPQ